MRGRWLRGGSGSTVNGAAPGPFHGHELVLPCDLHAIDTSEAPSVRGAEALL